MKVLLFTAHDHDPLCFAIKAATRAGYTHAALGEVNRDRPLEIAEAFYPEIRRRELSVSELAGIDVFAIAGITPEQEAKVLAFVDAAIAHHEKYSIANLFRFLAPVRAIIGEAEDDGTGRNPVFCSQFVFDALLSAGIKLLNAHSYEVAPAQLAWSTVLQRSGAMRA